MGKNFKNINEELERIKTLMFETDSLILNNKQPLNEQATDVVTDEQVTGTETGDKFKTARSSFKLAKVNDVNTLLRGGASKFDTYKVKGTGVMQLFDGSGKMTPEGIELMKKSGLKLPAGQIIMRIGKVDNPNTDKVFFQVIPAKELSIVTQSGDIKNIDPKELEKLPTVQDLKPSAPVVPTPTPKPTTTDTFTETKDFLIGKKIDDLAKQFNLKITDMTPQFKEQGWTSAAYYKRNDETKTVYGVNKDGIILSFFKRVKGAPKKGVSENFNMDLVFVNPLLFESVISEQDNKTVETENDYYIKMDGNGKETKMSDKFTQVVDGTYKGTPGGGKKKSGGGKTKTDGGDKTTTKTDWSAYPCVTKKTGYKKVKTDKGESYQSQGDRLWNYYADGTFTTKDSSGKVVDTGTYKCEGDTIKTTVKGGGSKPKTTVTLTDKDLMGETGMISNLMNSSVPTVVSLVAPLSIPLKLLSLGVSALAKVTRRTGVKGVVDALDGFVTADDLAYVLTAIKGLNGKVYFDGETNQNIPATRRFLELYSEDEGGDDLISDIRSVGTRTLPTGSEKLKSIIIRTINAQSSQSVSGVS